MDPPAHVTSLVFDFQVPNLLWRRLPEVLMPRFAAYIHDLHNFPLHSPRGRTNVDDRAVSA